MDWWKRLWSKPEEEIVDTLSVPKTVDVMKDDTDPEEVTELMEPST